MKSKFKNDQWTKSDITLMYKHKITDRNSSHIETDNFERNFPNYYPGCMYVCCIDSSNIIVAFNGKLYKVSNYRVTQYYPQTTTKKDVIEHYAFQLEVLITEGQYGLDENGNEIESVMKPIHEIISKWCEDMSNKIDNCLKLSKEYAQKYNLAEVNPYVVK